MQYDVYGVGNALVDIQARVSDATLEKLGFAKGIMTLVDEETQQKVLGELDGAPISQCAGGSAANTVLGVADFGGNAAYAGKVASDMLGEFDLADMRKLGVTIDVEPAPEGHTGTCVVLITEDAQRTMLTNLGVSASLSIDDLNEEHIKQSEYVYVEGYLFTGETQKRAAYRAIELAKKHGVKVAFTVSDPFLINMFRDEFQQLIEGPIDLLFCNLEEARSLTGKHDAVDCAHIIHKHVPNLALTLGPDGSILMHEGRVIPIEGVETDAIDTTGAGDMYAAGILYGITNGLNWHQAGHLASHAAARIVSQLGARLQKPFTEEDIKELLS
ncbi:5-dehydro-2-deoxygluconokinase [Gimesia alba]|uniref:5-dehydro-2-deoxygluconokinase n=1 Tax=Gimesia alba TaxID=2527973 RepID=A0A517R8L0_9PLAN|nr:adenosine kinase [Gimesia alba]QDT40234.1 5-dehydro-2-deoxygluconokinase [Gimesia alba]